jgi:hypothetical protein
MGITVRGLLRTAKKFGVKPAAFNYERCAVGLIGLSVGLPYRSWFGPGKYAEAVAKKAGIPYEVVRAIESGFEDRLDKNYPHLPKRYVRVGENLRKKVYG